MAALNPNLKPYRRPLNPSFAAAHGLSHRDTKGTSSRLDFITKKARDTGKLVASDAKLVKLHDVLDLRVPVNLSLESSCSERFVAETLVLVDVCDNSELDWDEALLKCCMLKTFRARNCHYESWKANADSFQHLKKLDLSNNVLKKFDLNCLPRTIRELNLSSNQIGCLLSEPAKERTIDLPNLLHLSLEENQLKKIPLNLNFPMLQSLHCGKNNLSDLLILKQELPNLTTLDASNNSLATLPPNLEHLTSLTSFRIDFNDLSRLPRMPSTVVRAILNDNRITSLIPLDATTQEIVFPNVAILLVRNNCLTELEGKVVEQWVHLKTLDLYGNSIASLPYQLGFLPQLNSLQVDGNPLRSIRSTISDLKDTQAILNLLQKRAPDHLRPGSVSKTALTLTSILDNSSSLRIENKGLEELTNELLDELKAVSNNLSCIKHLQLSHNLLSEIHRDWFFYLPNLTKVDLDNNRIQTLSSSSLSNLENLAELRLSRNRLSDSFFEECNTFMLNNLQVFDISCNRLTKFPREFLKQVPNLRTLNLSANQITSGVDECRSLPSTLEIIDLSNNQLLQLGRMFPLSLAALCPLLRTLLLNNNNLGSIPLELGLLSSSLKTLDLRGNPQRAINYAVLERAAPELMKFMQNRMTVEQLASAKLILQEISSPSRPSELVNECTSGSGSDTSNKTDQRGSQLGGECTMPSTPKPVEKNDSSVRNSGQSSLVKGTKPSKDPVATEKINKSLDDSALMKELQQSIDSFSSQLADHSLSNAKRFAVKKQLAMARSKLIRERRRLEQENSDGAVTN